MIRTHQIDARGDAESLHLRKAPLPQLRAGEVCVRHTWVGVNFVDVYHRIGLYPLPAYPAAPGVEAVGVVDAVAEDVTGFAVGDRVAYAGLPAGSYADARTIPAARLIRLPDDLSDEQIAGSLLRGLTAYLLLHRVTSIAPGQTVLIHAAAGGLGLILVQWLKRLGATVIGTVGSREKAEIARAHGLDHAILYRDEDFVSAVADLTEGRGVDFAVDGIGGETLAKSLEAVGAFGTVANVGQVAGAIPPLDLQLLNNRFLIRPSVIAFLAGTVDYHAAADAWFAVLRGGLSVSEVQAYAFEDAALAHADMEAGRTTGAVRLRMN